MQSPAQPLRSLKKLICDTRNQEADGSGPVAFQDTGRLVGRIVQLINNAKHTLQRFRINIVSPIDDP